MAAAFRDVPRRRRGSSGGIPLRNPASRTGLASRDRAHDAARLPWPGTRPEGRRASPPDGVLHIVYPSLIADLRGQGHFASRLVRPWLRDRRSLPFHLPHRVPRRGHRTDRLGGRRLTDGCSGVGVVRRQGRRGLVRRRPDRPDLPAALLHGRDPVAAGRRARLLEREGGHPPGARFRTEGEARPGPAGGPRPAGGDDPTDTTTTSSGDPNDPNETTASGPVDTSGPSSVPIPLLVLGGLALLLLAAGGAGYLSRRAQARREGGPPGAA